MQQVSSSPQAVRFRGRSFLALMLAPEAPLAEWFAALDALLVRTPMFFVGRPVVLDLTRIAMGQGELRSLLAELQGRSVRIMGIEGAQLDDLDHDLPPPISGGRTTSLIEVGPSWGQGNAAEAPSATAAEEPLAGAATKEPRSLLIDAPVRSGQSIIFLDGDVTVIGSVASGAEIIAGGSVHVYGSLRGRALAGTTGNAAARIFCQKLDAELLAIDGLYRTAETIEPGFMRRPIQARLDGDSLVIKALS